NHAIVRHTKTQIENDIIPTKTLFQSDRGLQYTYHSFKQFIGKHQSIQNMSHVGRGIDNGPMEKVWVIIKEKRYRVTTDNTLEELEKDIKAYIKFYNTKRVTLKMGLNIPA